MKIALITDQHFGVRKGNRIYFDYYQNFYKNVFFPELDKQNINTVIDLGDTFDNRKSIDFLSLAKAKEMFYEPIMNRNISIHMLVGNHTSFYKNTNQVNSPDLLLKEYDNISIYEKVQDIDIGNIRVTMLPWINQENEKEVMSHLYHSNASVLFGHLEINGFMAHAGHIFEGGLDRGIFSKYKKVFSGHFHHKSSSDNIHYLGNPYHLYWNDYGEFRGFHILDTDTLNTQFILNPYTIFKKFYYDDSENDYSGFDFSSYKNTFVKLYVNKKTDAYLFDKFLKELYEVGVFEVKVIEDTDYLNSVNEESVNLDSEDTLSVLQAYIDEVNYHDTSSLKSAIKKLYMEAIEVN